MERTEEQINAQIKQLLDEKKRLKIKTADGHPFVIGETYTAIDFWGDIEEIQVTKYTEFSEYTLWVDGFEIDYKEIWKDAELGKKTILDRLADKVKSAEARVVGEQKNYDRMKEKLYGKA